jgi:hypothetical protein
VAAGEQWFGIAIGGATLDAARRHRLATAGAHLEARARGMIASELRSSLIAKNIRNISSKMRLGKLIFTYDD